MIRLIIIAAAMCSVFHWTGDEEYREKGSLLAFVSGADSTGVLLFLPYATFWMVGLNVLFFIVLTVINLCRDELPGSSHGS